jgi:hypothetical protein
MTQTNKFFSLLFTPLLWKRALTGAGIGLVLLLIFLTIVGALDEGSWIFVTMLTVAVSGACGGVFYHVASLLPIENGWKKVLANVVCLLVFLVGLWMGLVYGLSLVGLWN